MEMDLLVTETRVCGSGHLRFDLRFEVVRLGHVSGRLWIAKLPLRILYFVKTWTWD